MPADLFADTPTIDPNKDYYTELVGAGKKYSDNQAFARSRVEADVHIAKLEDEQSRLRAELSTRIQYEDFLDKLKSTSLSPPQNTPVTEPNKDLSVLTPEQIERLLENKLQQRDSERTAEQNLNTVVAKLEETYGPNYAQHLKRQTDELGMSQESVRTLAASNPKVLFKLLSIGDKPTRDNLFTAPPRSDASFKPTTIEKRGDAYYEAIRKKDPNLYWTPRIQNEMFDRIKEIGIDNFNNS